MAVRSKIRRATIVAAAAAVRILKMRDLIGLISDFGTLIRDLQRDLKARKEGKVGISGCKSGRRCDCHPRGDDEEIAEMVARELGPPLEGLR